MTGDALQERVTIVNFAEHDETVDVTLELADDAADIFEVRGYPRDRGTLLPIAATDDRATFQYDGLDDHRSRTHVVVLGAGRAGPGPPGRRPEPRRRDPLPLGAGRSPPAPRTS